MIHPVIRIFGFVPLALALCAPFADPGAAQNAMPALRAHVTVTGEIVHIGDLVENAGPVAEVPIFRAPDLGTRGTVATARIVEAIRPHQLIGIDTRGLAEVVVTRASRAITPQQISARVAQTLAGQYGFGEAHNILIEFDRAVHTLNVEPTATGELQVLALAYNPRTSRFDVTFDLPSSAALPRQATRFTGTATETIDALTVDHPIEHGEVLKASDLTVSRRAKAEGAAITDMQAAIGLAARHELRPGQPLHQADLMKPAIVQRNDTVTIVYEAPGVTLTLRGQAQDAGALGDTISVLNLQSKHVVQGVVSGPGRVTVAATTTHFVANAPAPAASLAPASLPPPSETPQPEHSVE
jgi:flagellar basal body P-ring formation protein FlgA